MFSIFGQGGFAIKVDGPLSSPVWSFLYDARGNRQFVTDPLGNVTEYVYNERNWVEQTIEADPDGAG
jgi:YD repeat-containing protein